MHSKFVPARDVPHVLIPFDIREAMTVAEAAKVAGCTGVTARAWAAEFDLGRRVGGKWLISRVAFAMFLESDKVALRAYLAGNRESPAVAAYFERFGITVSEKISKEKAKEANTENLDMVSGDD
jgi:hypothetical protein